MKTILKALTGVLVLLLVVCVALVCNLSRPPVVHEFKLVELSDGVYAYREKVVSSIPAENYTMATVCAESGEVITVKGEVNIVNTDTKSPYAVYEDTNMVNRDKITIYAPITSVVYLGAISVGRR